MVQESDAAVAQIWITGLISLTLNDSVGSPIDSSFFLAWGVLYKNEDARHRSIGHLLRKIMES